LEKFFDDTIESIKSFFTEGFSEFSAEKILDSADSMKNHIKDVFTDKPINWIVVVAALVICVVALISVRRADRRDKEIEKVNIEKSLEYYARQAYMAKHGYMAESEYIQVRDPKYDMGYHYSISGGTDGSFKSEEIEQEAGTPNEVKNEADLVEEAYHDTVVPDNAENEGTVQVISENEVKYSVKDQEGMVDMKPINISFDDEHEVKGEPNIEIDTVKIDEGDISHVQMRYNVSKTGKIYAEEELLKTIRD